MKDYAAIEAAMMGPVARVLRPPTAKTMRLALVLAGVATAEDVRGRPIWELRRHWDTLSPAEQQAGRDEEARRTRAGRRHR